MQFLIGTYTRPDGARAGNGEGIYCVSFDPSDGAFGTPKLLHKCINPSWLEMSPDQKNLFAVCETSAPDTRGVMVFDSQSPDALTLLDHHKLQGELPCHLAFDPHHNRLASAQYGTGNIEIFTFQALGTQTAKLHACAQFQCAGSGPNAQLQDGPHAHFVTFSDQGAVLHAVDLGSDRLYSIALRADHSICETAVLDLPTGAGPRHMVLNSDASHAWLLCELDKTLVSLNRDGLGWQVEQILPAFSLEDHKAGEAAAICRTKNGAHIYASGRQKSRIAGFRADGTKICEIGSGGKAPRDITVTSDDGWILAANQVSNTLTSLRRDPRTGELQPSGYSCAVGSPVSLLEIKSK